MAAHLVWVIRRDGWMRRVEVGFPYPQQFRIAEPLEHLVDLHPKALPDGGDLEKSVVETRLFQKRTLQKPAGVNWLPWDEPCYYCEV